MARRPFQRHPPRTRAGEGRPERPTDEAGTADDGLDGAAAEAGALARQLEAEIARRNAAESALRAQSAELRAALDQVERERRRFEELFRAAPVPYLITDLDGRIREANDAASALLHTPRKRLPGHSLIEYLRPARELKARLERLARMEVVEDWEAELDVAGDEAIPVSMSGTPARASDGTVAEVRWVLLDARQARATTERERMLQREQAARAMLERVAERAAFLSDASARLMGVLNRDAVWQIAARLAEPHAAGVALLELRGEAEDLLEVRAVSGTPELRERLEPWSSRVLDLREDRPGEHFFPLSTMRAALRRKDVSVASRWEDELAPGRHGGSLAIPVVTDQGVVGLLVVWIQPGSRLGAELLMHRSLAERVGLALQGATLFEEVLRARRRAEEATAAEADFLAMVSHELRTPLTAITSYAELLASHADELPGKMGRYAQQIAGAARHQRQLVEQILNYKQVQRENLDAVEEEELDFRDVVQFAVSMVRPQAEGRPVEVLARVPENPLHGVCDSGKLRQVLANLLSNAIRHTAEGQVRVDLGTDGELVVLTVADTGEGIARENLPRIYDRFWRGPSQTGEQRGSGLGLTITRELVTRMGGEIGVESEPGRGTTFTVRIPRIGPSRSASS